MGGKASSPSPPPPPPPRRSSPPKTARSPTPPPPMSPPPLSRRSPPPLSTRSPHPTRSRQPLRSDDKIKEEITNLMATLHDKIRSDDFMEIIKRIYKLIKRLSESEENTAYVEEGIQINLDELLKLREKVIKSTLANLV